MLKAGAHGYVVKTVASEELRAAIHAAAQGKRFLCTESTRTMTEGVQQPNGSKAPPVTVLSPREREVLRLLAAGQRAATIAATLHISVGTVEVHRRKIKEKLRIRTTAELTRYAIREGLSAS
jgi:two-component system NarL family response regulator